MKQLDSPYASGSRRRNVSVGSRGAAVQSSSSRGIHGDRTPQTARRKGSDYGRYGNRRHGRYAHRHYYSRYGSPYRYYSPFSYWSSYRYPYYWAHHDYNYFHYPFLYVPFARTAGGRSSYAANGMGALDLDVSPEKAQVFIDGEMVGVADNFDGFPTYLWLEQGTYDVVFFLDGYETLARQYTIYPGAVIDVEDRLLPGQSLRPEELISTETVNREERLRRDRERAESGRARAELRTSEGSDEVGRLHLRAWPADAAVYLDGHFIGVADELANLSAGLLVEPGRHTIEVMRPGYASERTKVVVEAGKGVELDIQLDEGSI